MMLLDMADSSTLYRRNDMGTRSLYSIFQTIVLIFGASSGAIAASPDSLHLSWWGAFELGQIRHGFYGSTELDHKWQERFYAQLIAEAKVNERLNINVTGEWMYQYSVLETQTNGMSLLPGVSFYLHRADMVYKLLQGTYPLNIQFGYFPFKYNEFARNLG
jgi:hypothetical protein